MTSKPVSDKQIHIHVDSDKSSTLSSDNKETTTPYERYIIRMNESLQAENTDLKIKLAEQTSANEEFEDQIDRDDKSKVYIKGLLKNLVELDRKRSDVCNITEEMLRGYVDHVKSWSKQLKSSCDICSASLLAIYVLALFTVSWSGFLCLTLSNCILGSYMYKVRHGCPPMNITSFKSKLATLKTDIKVITDAQDFIHDYMDSL